MSDRKLPKHSPDSTLDQDIKEGETSRREFLRRSTVLSASAAAAYVFVGSVKDGNFVADAEASPSKMDPTDATGQNAADSGTKVASRPRSRKGWRQNRNRRRRGTSAGMDLRFFDKPDIDFG